MLIRNKTRIENLEEHKSSTQDEFLVIKLVNGDEVTINYEDKTYNSEEEFLKLYPKVTFITVEFIS